MCDYVLEENLISCVETGLEAAGLEKVVDSRPVRGGNPLVGAKEVFEGQDGSRLLLRVKGVK